ncbi:hypothetical protein HGG75_17400 [Ochrobactrum pseudogrignonense]|nr:hypothetical protein [Brucella pseudogrignonensis]
MRGADILVQMLIGYGVETIFGVPGDLEQLGHLGSRQILPQRQCIFSRCERSKPFS